MRTHDAVYLQSIADHPHVRKWSGAREIDADAQIYCRLDGGYLLFVPLAFDCWEIHISMLPKSPPAKPQVLRAIEWLRSEYEVHKFVAFIPSINRPARILATACGFSQCGRIGGLAVIDGSRCDVLIYES